MNLIEVNWKIRLIELHCIEAAQYKKKSNRAKRSKKKVQWQEILRVAVSIAQRKPTDVKLLIIFATDFFRILRALTQDSESFNYIKQSENAPQHCTNVSSTRSHHFRDNAAAAVFRPAKSHFPSLFVSPCN